MPGRRARDRRHGRIDPATRRSWARGAARTGRRWRRSARSSRSRGGSIAVVHRPMPAACDAASSRRASSSACCRCSTRSVTSRATPTKASGSPALVALDHPARHHVAVAAVGAPVARLHVGRLVGGERLLGGGEHQRDVVRVDERAHLLDREALGPRLLLQQLEGAVAVVHALGAQVVAPDRDLAEVDGELELGVDVDQRPRRLVGVGVVHHDADGAVGRAVRAVLHRPLRMDQARLAVGLDDPVALRIAAGAGGSTRRRSCSPGRRDGCAGSPPRTAACRSPGRGPRSRTRDGPSGLRRRECAAPRGRCGRTPARCRASRPGGAPARRGSGSS